jgi:hypothetical protein
LNQSAMWEIAQMRVEKESLSILYDQ